MGKSIYLQILEDLQNSYKYVLPNHQGISTRMYLTALLLETIYVSDIFKKVDESLKEGPRIDIDRDVDYFKWVEPETWPNFKVLSQLSSPRWTLHSALDQGIFNEGIDGLSHYFPAKDDSIESEKNQKIISLVSFITTPQNWDDSEFYYVVLLSLSELINTLKHISYATTINITREDAGKIYDNLYSRNIGEQAPKHMSLRDGLRFHLVELDYKEWKHKCTIPPSKEVLKVYIVRQAIRLIKTDFLKPGTKELYKFQDDKYRNDPYIKMAGCDFLDSDYLAYVVLGQLLNYNDGLFYVNDKCTIGKYIYQWRKVLSDNSIEAFFNFIRFNELVRDDIEIMSICVVDPDRKDNMRHIWEERIDYLENTDYVCEGYSVDTIKTILYKVMFEEQQDSRFVRAQRLLWKEFTEFNSKFDIENVIKTPPFLRLIGRLVNHGLLKYEMAKITRALIPECAQKDLETLKTNIRDGQEYKYPQLESCRDLIDKVAKEVMSEEQKSS